MNNLYSDAAEAALSPLAATEADAGRRTPILAPSTSAKVRGHAASKLRDSIFRRALLAADATAIMGSFIVTMAFSSRPHHFTPATALAVVSLLIAAKVSGLYDRDEALLRKTTLDEFPRLFQLATLAALVSWLVAGLVFSGRLDGNEALILWVSLTVMLVFMRTTARAVALRVAPVERCLFIGEESVAAAIGSKLKNHGGIRADLVAHLDFDKLGPWSAEAHAVGRLAEIRELAATLDVQRAIVAPRSADAGEVLDLVRTLKAVGVRVSVLPRLLEVVGSSVEFDNLHGITVMGVRRFELTRSSAIIKRSFDLFFASVGLVSVAPLAIAAAVAIKLDSPGPVFFRQRRVGRHGARFRIFKFRTMVDEAEQLKGALADRNEVREGMFKIADDPRVTRVGRLLRKTAFDEVPQLINVIKGEMSLVGPRPLVLDEDQRVHGWHRRRLALTPGMTGHWQILGPARVTLPEMVAMDYLYVANWSLWADLKILLRTVPYVLGARGL